MLHIKFRGKTCKCYAGKIFGLSPFGLGVVYIELF